MPSIILDSHKPKLGRESTYPLTTTDLEKAIQPHLVEDIFLSANFNPHQSGRKAHRDRVEALGEYRLLDCSYHKGGSHLTKADRPEATWKGVPGAQVVLAEIFAVPQTALMEHVGLRTPLAQLLAEAIAALASGGLPNKGSPRDAWILELGLDERVHTAFALLRTWNGGEYAVSRRMEVVLAPPSEKRHG